MQKNNNFMFVNLSNKEDFLHEHEIFEIMHSRKLYQVQIDLRRKLKKRIRALEAEQKVKATQFDTKRTLFLQKIADRKRKRPPVKDKKVSPTRHTSNVMDVRSGEDFWVTNDESLVYRPLNKAYSEPLLVSSPVPTNRSLSSLPRTITRDQVHIEADNLDANSDNYPHGTLRLPPINAFRDMKSKTSIQFNRMGPEYCRSAGLESLHDNSEEGNDPIQVVRQNNVNIPSDEDSVSGYELPSDNKINEDDAESVSYKTVAPDKMLRRHQAGLKTAMSLPDLRQVAILPGNQVFVMGKLMNETEYRALLDKYRQARVARIKKVERKYKLLEQKIKDFHLDEKHKNPYSQKRDLTRLFIQ